MFENGFIVRMDGPILRVVVAELVQRKFLRRIVVFVIILTHPFFLYEISLFEDGNYHREVGRKDTQTREKKRERRSLQSCLRSDFQAKHLMIYPHYHNGAATFLIWQ